MQEELQPSPSSQFPSSHSSPRLGSTRASPQYPEPSPSSPPRRSTREVSEQPVERPRMIHKRLRRTIMLPPIGKTRPVPRADEPAPGKAFPIAFGSPVGARSRSFLREKERGATLA